MARTYRRKNAKLMWDEDFYMQVFNKNNKQMMARFHSDAWNYHRFKTWVKRTWAHRRRQWDRQELANFAKVENYEPIWFTTKIDTWWWD